MRIPRVSPRTIRAALWTALCLAVGGIFLWVMFPHPDVKDTPVKSPDGRYTAILHSVDNGTAGSYCQVLLEPAGDSDKREVIADGGWETFDSVQWIGSHRLQIKDGSISPPDPTWKKTWRDVQVVYVP